MEQPSAETAVFVDTNLGTRLALSVPADITAGDLKRKLKHEHGSCFPNLGKIIVHSIMVKKKSNFYHIPNSMLIKEACRGFRRTWFLRIDASKLADISRQQDTMPSSANHCRRDTSSNQGEIIKSDFNKVSAPCNFISRSNSESSTSNSCRTSNIEGCTISSLMTTNMTDQAGEIARGCPSCEEGKADMLSSSIKRRKLAQNNQGNAISTEEAVITRKVYKSVPGPGFDSELEVTKGDIMKDEAPHANQKDITWLSAYLLEGGQNKNSFWMEEDPSVSMSEKISVSGLILKYFADCDQADSKGMLQIVGETANSTLQMNNTLNCQSSPATEETGSAAKNVKYIADGEATYEAQSDCDTACSFNVTPTEANQVCSMNNKNRKNNKGIPTASDVKGQPKTINSSKKRKKSQISSTQVNRKLVLSPPHSISRFSPRTPFKKNSKSLSSSISKCEVGNRLVQAANKICSPFIMKKPLMSLNSRCENLSTPDSVITARRLCFQMDGFDDIFKFDF